MNISLRPNKPNFTVVTLDNLTIWFSYSTPIAFHESGRDPIFRENSWGPTTGKHINAVKDEFGLRGKPVATLAGLEFESALRVALRDA